jgi:glycine cleavage system H protein
LNVPNHLKYTATHEWVSLEGDIATIGITDFAQSELGDIVYVESPTPGRVVGAEDKIGSVESVKTVSDFYSPVAGEITDVNEALGAQPELLNSDPYGAGWLFKMKVTGSFDGLLDAGAYAASLG